MSAVHWLDGPALTVITQSGPHAHLSMYSAKGEVRASLCWQLWLSHLTLFVTVPSLHRAMLLWSKCHLAILSPL